MLAFHRGALRVAQPVGRARTGTQGLCLCRASTAGRCSSGTFAESPCPSAGVPGPSVSEDPTHRPVQPALHSPGCQAAWLHFCVHILLTALHPARAAGAVPAGPPCTGLEPVKMSVGMPLFSRFVSTLLAACSFDSCLPLSLRPFTCDHSQILHRET